MRRMMRRSLGMLRVAVHLLKGAAIMAFVFPLVGRDRRRRIIKRWSGRVLDIFGLALSINGQPAVSVSGRPLMLVGNHISWVDIYAYLYAADVRFVAKSEVRSWPLIGWFATNLGTIFVDRDRPRDAVRVGDEMRRALDRGEVVCVFPEGTTTDGSIVLPFSSVLIGAAIDKAVVLQPVSIAYCRPDGEICRRAAFTGDATLVASIWQLAGGERSHVRLTFLAPIDARGAHRRTLARLAEDDIRTSLGHLPRLLPGRDSEETAAVGAPAVRPQVRLDAG